MEIKEYIQHQIASARRLSDAVVQGLTDEQFNWTPPGTANPIRALLVHLLAAEDLCIHSVFQGKPTLWQSDSWGAKIGLSSVPGVDDWQEAKSSTLTLQPVLAYQAAVRAAADDYFAKVTPSELERQVKFFGNDRPVADVLCITLGHSLCHAGEMAAIKGVRGDKGWPF
jgi:hypothetical protein